MKKYFTTAILIILLLTVMLTPAAALVEPSADYFVTDAAGVLTQVTKDDIISANLDLEERCSGAQIVVVTVEYKDAGMDSEEYAAALFNDWGVGSLEGGNNGMLLLLVTGEGKAWLHVGAGIYGVFNGKMIDEYFDRYFWEEFDAGNYDTAVRNMLEALFSWYAGYYGINPGTQGNQDGNYVPDYPQDWQPYYYETYEYSPWSRFVTTFWLIAFVFVIIIIAAAAGADRRRHRAYYMHMGMPIPVYHWWYMWGHRPHRIWYNNHWRGPRGPRGPGGFGGPGTPPRGPGGGGGGRSGGGFGGFGGGGFGGGGGGRR